MMRTIPCFARVRVHSKMFRHIPRPIQKYTVIYKHKPEKEKPITFTITDTFSNRLAVKIIKVYIVSYCLIVIGAFSASLFIIGNIAIY